MGKQITELIDKLAVVDADDDFPWDSLDLRPGFILSIAVVIHC